jgi:hypothetical protein
MVDLALLQSVSYIAGALGVCVAAVYYVTNLKETMKNRKAAFTNTILSTLSSKEGIRDWYEIMSMQWTDFEDFQRKYDSRVNPENYIKRNYYWNMCDGVAWHLRSGLIDWDTVRKSGKSLRLMWLKFKPIIEEYRRREYGLDSFTDWEYLADRVEEVESVEDKQRRKFMMDDAFRHKETRIA